GSVAQVGALAILACAYTNHPGVGHLACTVHHANLATTLVAHQAPCANDGLLHAGGLNRRAPVSLLQDVPCTVGILLHVAVDRHVGPPFIEILNEANDTFSLGRNVLWALRHGSHRSRGSPSGCVLAS